MPRHQVCSCLSWLFSLSLSLSLGLATPVYAQPAAGNAATVTSLPRVTLLRADDGQAGDEDRTNWPWEYVFEDPARFAWLGFDKYGCQVEQDALVIYEGMTVRVERDGRFELRCRVEAPKTPITVRLQLTIPEHHTASGQNSSITIPPFRITPIDANDRDDLNASSDTYEVVYVGRSEVLRRLNRELLSKHENNAKSSALVQKSMKEENYKQSFLALEEAKTAYSNAISQRDEAKRAVPAVMKPKAAAGDAPKQADGKTTVKPNKGAAEGDDKAGQLKEGKVAMPTLEQQRQAAEHLAACEQAVAATLNQLQAAEHGYQEANRAVLAAQQRIDQTPATSQPRSLKDEAGISFIRSGSTRFGSIPKK